MMVIAIDNGLDHLVYARPVFSHYEFDEPMGVRLTVLEWKNRLNTSPPTPAPWTASYFVPGTYKSPIRP